MGGRNLLLINVNADDVQTFRENLHLFNIFSLTDLDEIKEFSIIYKPEIIIISHFFSKNEIELLRALRHIFPKALILCHSRILDLELILSSFRNGVNDLIVGQLNPESFQSSLTRLDWQPSRPSNLFWTRIKAGAFFRLMCHWVLFWKRKSDVVPRFIPRGKPARAQKNQLHLKAFLLGGFKVQCKDKGTIKLPGKKWRSVLAYLFYYHKKKIARDVLIRVFWPSSTFSSARNNLHVALHFIRKSFAHIHTNMELILFEHECYFWNPEVIIELDVEKFLNHLKQAMQIEYAKGLDAAIDQLTISEAIYRGDLMEEISADPWIEPEREKLTENYLYVLNKLSKYHEEKENFLKAIFYCERLLQRDSCREDIHRRLMKCYFYIGQREKAISQYQKCVTVLAKELGIHPSQTTDQLFRELGDIN